MPRRDSGLPPETLNMMVERLPAREGQPQNISKNHAEQQDLSNSRNILHCGDGISRHTGGTCSHGGMMEYPRCPISELHLAKFPDSMEFESWKVNFKTEVCAKTANLKSRCHGSQKLREQSQLTNRVHRNQFLGEQVSKIVKCWM